MQQRRRPKPVDSSKGVVWTEDDLYEHLDTVAEPPFLLILDCITDPHNLGACLRSANAAGVHAVVIPKDRSAPLTDTVVHVARGAAEHTPLVRVTNLARTMDELRKRGIWLAGTSDHATESIYRRDLTGPLGVVMGAEGEGLRRRTEEKCDYLVKIPMGGTVDCLNVSVATGICLFEALRQRRQPK